MKDPHLVQSQEDIRLTQASPLDAQPLESALLTQEIRAAFAEEGGVIHEVDEENENAGEEGQRISLLKVEKHLASQGDDDNLETKQNFVASAHIKHAAEVDSLQ